MNSPYFFWLLSVIIGFLYVPTTLILKKSLVSIPLGSIFLTVWCISGCAFLGNTLMTDPLFRGKLLERVKQLPWAWILLGSLLTYLGLLLFMVGVSKGANLEVIWFSLLVSPTYGLILRRAAGSFEVESKIKKICLGLSAVALPLAIFLNDFKTIAPNSLVVFSSILLSFVFTLHRPAWSKEESSIVWTWSLACTLLWSTASLVLLDFLSVINILSVAKSTFIAPKAMSLFFLTSIFLPGFSVALSLLVLRPCHFLLASQKAQLPLRLWTLLFFSSFISLAIACLFLEAYVHVSMILACLAHVTFLRVGVSRSMKSMDAQNIQTIQAVKTPTPLSEKSKFTILLLLIGLWSFSHQQLAFSDSVTKQSSEKTLKTLSKLEKAMEILQKKEGFSAEFKQDVFSALRNKTTSTEGILLYQKPMKFLWEIKGTAKELYVSNGKTLWKYSELTKDSQEYPIDKIGDHLSFLSLLFGNEKVENLYNLDDCSEFNPKQKSGRLITKLVPKTDGLQKFICIVVNEKKGWMEEIYIVHRSGNKTTLSFKNYREEKISNDRFEFKRPQDKLKDKPRTP